MARWISVVLPMRRRPVILAKNQRFRPMISTVIRNSSVRP